MTLRSNLFLFDYDMFGCGGKNRLVGTFPAILSLSTSSSAEKGQGNCTHVATFHTFIAIFFITCQMINPTDLRKVTTHTRNLRDGVQGQVDAKMTVDTAAHIPNVIHFFCLCIWTYHSSYMKLSLIFLEFYIL